MRIQKNTNFSNANCVLTSMKYYKFSDATKEEYIIMQTTIDTIDRVTGNDEVEYYYYLSENPNESDITDWIKIDEKQQANNKLLFTVNTKRCKKYFEIKRKRKKYIFILGKLLKKRKSICYIFKRVRYGL